MSSAKASNERADVADVFEFRADEHEQQHRQQRRLEHMSAGVTTTSGSARAPASREKTMA